MTSTKCKLEMGQLDILKFSSLVTPLTVTSHDSLITIIKYLLTAAIIIIGE